MERLGYGREHDYGDEDDYGHGDGEQVHDHQDGPGEEYQNWHDDAEDLTGAVEHQAEYAADADAQADRLSVQFGWRFKARGSRRGKRWVPPSTKGHSTPVFVRVEDLQKRDGDSPTDVPPFGSAGEEQPS